MISRSRIGAACPFDMQVNNSERPAEKLRLLANTLHKKIHSRVFDDMKGAKYLLWPAVKAELGKQTLL